MTISSSQSVEASSGLSPSTLDTLELLLFVREVLNTLQLDSVGEVLDKNEIQVDLGEDNEVGAISSKYGIL